MNCDFVQSNLTQLVDNKLLPETKSRIEKHLQSCAGCRHVVAQYRKLWDIWDEPIEITPSPVFWPNLIQRIEAFEGHRLSKHPFLIGYRYWLRPIAAAAFLFLGVLVGYHLGNFPASTESTEPSQTNFTEEQFVDDRMGMFNDFPEGSLIASYLDLGQNNGSGES